MPALASMIETRQGFDTAEMRSAVTALEVAGRDRAWYAAHGAFAAAQGARVQLASFAAHWLGALYGEEPPLGSAVEQANGTRESPWAMFGVLPNADAPRLPFTISA